MENSQQEFKSLTEDLRRLYVEKACELIGYHTPWKTFKECNAEQAEKGGKSNEH